MVTGSLASKVPARIGSAAFLAPDIRTWPESRAPPCMSSLSTTTQVPPACCHSAGVIARMESA